MPHNLTAPKTAALSDEEARLAESSGRALQELLRRHSAATEQEAGSPQQAASFRVSVEKPGGGGERVELALPGAAIPHLLSVLRELGHGRGVAVVATDAEVTTRRAADFLHVSRPYLVKLLDEGRIPFRNVGPRRRVRVADLLAYKADEEARRHRGLDELAAEAQKLGMY